MEINEIKAKVFPVKGDSSTKAFASVTIDAITINGIRVVEGANGLFAALPQSRDKDGNFRDIVFIADKDLKQAVSDAVMSEFKNPQAREAKSVGEALKDYKPLTNPTPANNAPKKSYSR